MSARFVPAALIVLFAPGCGVPEPADLQFDRPIDLRELSDEVELAGVALDGQTGEVVVLDAWRGLTAGGVYLVKGALGAANGVDRASIARFYAENLVGQSGALRDGDGVEAGRARGARGRGGRRVLRPVHSGR